MANVSVMVEFTLMPHQDRGLLVFGDRAHGLALLGEGDEQLQRDHDGDAEQHRYDGRSVDFEFAKHQRWNFNDGWHGLIISAEQRLGAGFQAAGSWRSQ